MRNAKCNTPRKPDQSHQQFRAIMRRAFLVAERKGLPTTITPEETRTVKA